MTAWKIDAAASNALSSMRSLFPVAVWVCCLIFSRLRKKHAVMADEDKNEQWSLRKDAAAKTHCWWYDINCSISLRGELAFLFCRSASLARRFFCCATNKCCQQGIMYLSSAKIFTIAREHFFRHMTHTIVTARGHTILQQEIKDETNINFSY